MKMGRAAAGRRPLSPHAGKCAPRGPAALGTTRAEEPHTGSHPITAAPEAEEIKGDMGRHARSEQQSQSPFVS